MALTLTYFDSESFCGYKQFTTFFQDFSIADLAGTKAIQNTFDRAFKEWKSQYKYLTELVMVLNWKSWEHATTRPEYSELYVDLYHKAREYALDNLKGAEFEYFFRTTD